MKLTGLMFSRTFIDKNWIDEFKPTWIPIGV